MAEVISKRVGVRQRLAELVEGLQGFKDPTEVAMFLQEGGYKGIRLNCFHCPVAAYFNTGFDGWDDVVRVTVGPHQINVVLGSGGIISEDTPLYVGTFITRFDSSEYPMLVDRDQETVFGTDGELDTTHPVRVARRADGRVVVKCVCDNEDDRYGHRSCDVHVSCDTRCRALKDPDPNNGDQVFAAYEHWQWHGCLSGCSHGC